MLRPPDVSGTQDSELRITAVLPFSAGSKELKHRILTNTDKTQAPGSFLFRTSLPGLPLNNGPCCRLCRITAKWSVVKRGGGQVWRDWKWRQWFGGFVSGSTKKTVLFLYEVLNQQDFLFLFCKGDEYWDNFLPDSFTIALFWINNRGVLSDFSYLGILRCTLFWYMTEKDKKTPEKPSNRKTNKNVSSLGETLRRSKLRRWDWALPKAEIYWDPGQSAAPPHGRMFQVNELLENELLESSNGWRWCSWS